MYISKYALPTIVFEVIVCVHSQVPLGNSRILRRYYVHIPSVPSHLGIVLVAIFRAYAQVRQVNSRICNECLCIHKYHMRLVKSRV
jgi:hypothetical protein